MVSRTLASSDWKAAACLHAERVSGLADRFLTRRSRGEKHPVEDFLFTYYPFQATRLKQWMPDIWTALEVSAEDLREHPWLTARGGEVIDQTLRLGPPDAAALRAASFMNGRWSIA
jgi:hypothetical protein